MGCRLTGRTVVFEAAYRGSNPRIPAFAPEAQMAEHAVDNRAVEGSSPSGCIEVVGSWASWSGRSPVKAEITGSSPVGPVEI